jgi:hypothetical protein
MLGLAKASKIWAIIFGGRDDSFNEFRCWVGRGILGIGFLVCDPAFFSVSARHKEVRKLFQYFSGVSMGLGNSISTIPCPAYILEQIDSLLDASSSR